MPKKKYPTDFRWTSEKGIAKIQHPPGTEHGFSAVETGAKTQYRISEMKQGEGVRLLVALADYIRKQGIDLENQMLQNGFLPSRYEQKGMMLAEAGGTQLVIFGIPEENYVYVGTLEEYKQVVKDY